METKTDSLVRGLVAVTAPTVKGEENGKLSARECLLTSWSEDCRASVTAPKEPLVSCNHQDSVCECQARCLGLGIAKLQSTLIAQLLWALSALKLRTVLERVGA